MTKKGKKIQSSSSSASSSASSSSSSAFPSVPDQSQPIRTKRNTIQSTLDALPWQASSQTNLRDDVLEEGLGMVEEIPADSYEIQYLPGGGILIHMKDKDTVGKNKTKDTSMTSNNDSGITKDNTDTTITATTNPSTILASSSSSSSSSSNEKTKTKEKKNIPGKKTNENSNRSNDTTLIPDHVSESLPSSTTATVSAKETGTKRKRDDDNRTTILASTTTNEKQPTPKNILTTPATVASSPLHAEEEAILTSATIVKKVTKNTGSKEGIPPPSTSALPPAPTAPKLGPLLRTGTTVNDIQEAWSLIHVTNPLLLANLANLGYREPTPIQSRTIPNALVYYKDIIGTAETGSGKTLAYSLPIIHRLLERRERLRMTTSSSAVPSSTATTDGSLVGTHFSYLPALIITPTRELAIQVRDHITALTMHTSVKVISIVGGLAPEKQDRTIRRHPDIIVGTPGRLWDVIRSGNYSFLNHLDTLQFLVLDEADRLVEKGSFEALNGILNLLKDATTKKNQSKTKKGGQGEEDEAEAFVDDIAEKIIKEKNAKLKKPSSTPTPDGQDNDHDDNRRSAITDSSSSSTKVQYVDPPFHYKRQTFLFSATLGVTTAQSVQNAAEALVHATTLSSTDGTDGTVTHVSKKAKQRALNQAQTLSPVEALMVRVGMLGKPELISASLSTKEDRSRTTTTRRTTDNDNDDKDGDDDGDEKERNDHRSTNPNSSSSSSTTTDVIVALPEGLELGRITCSDPQDKDVRLYTFLSQYSGRSLIFVNAISTLKRLYSLLASLNLPVYTLHAHMLQKQRLSHLERYRCHSNSILIATDVAARGLDIPDVDYVLHYMLPVSAETFIHRCGRTARGQHKQGLTLALISPADSSLYNRIMNVLHFSVGLPEFPLDPQYLVKFIPRIALGRQIAEYQSQLDKETELSHWLTNTTQEAELGIDDTLITALGSNKGQLILMNEHQEELTQQKKKKMKMMKNTPKTGGVVARDKNDDDDEEEEDKADKEALDTDDRPSSGKPSLAMDMDEDERSEAYAHAKLLRQQLVMLRKKMTNLLKESILPTGFISRKYVSSTQTYQQNRNTQGLSIKSLITVNSQNIRSTIKHGNDDPDITKTDDDEEGTTMTTVLPPSTRISSSSSSGSNSALRAPRIFISHGSSTVPSSTDTTNGKKTRPNSSAAATALFPQQSKNDALALLQHRGKYKYIPAVQKAQIQAKHAFQLQKHQQKAKYKSAM